MILKNVDPFIAECIAKEEERQRSCINLIASENYVSQAVLEATGSVLTNKYAEGYPGKRYYGGCQWVDQAENAAIERCKQLFGAEHVNVQPHAGSQANMAAYLALLQPGDTILGMSLSAGGHLTHGHKVNFSGKLYNAIQYGVNKETEQLDYNEIAQLAQQHKPKLIIVGASAYSRTIDFAPFKEIADSVNAYLLADIAHIAGLIAAKLHPSPIGIADVVTSTTHKTLRGPRGGLIMARAPFAESIDKTIIPGMQGGPLMHVIAAKAVAFQEALQPSFKEYQQQVIQNSKRLAGEFVHRGYRLVAGGTDNHLFLLDVRSKQCTGYDAQRALETVGIVVNRNAIPFDPEKPWVTSGIRIGTPFITTRGFKEDDMPHLAALIDEAIIHRNNSMQLEKIAQEVVTFARKFDKE